MVYPPGKGKHHFVEQTRGRTAGSTGQVAAAPEDGDSSGRGAGGTGAVVLNVRVVTEI